MKKAVGLAATLLVALLIPLAFGSTQPKPGSLDPKFGKAGIVTTAVAEGAISRTLAIQPDGKVIAAGTAGAGLHHDIFVLVRYRQDGSRDSSFGTQGVTTADFGGLAQVYALAIQRDGKIIAVGGYQVGGRFLLARFGADGSLDPTFGQGGKVVTLAPPGGYASAVALQPDGRIVVAGTTYGGGCCGYYDADFMLARYNEDGSLDDTFGNGGIVTTDFGAYDWANAVAVLPNGKILAAGGSLVEMEGIGTWADFALARYQPDGSLDPSFGAAGKVLNQFPIRGYTVASGLAPLPHGKFLVSGEWVLARYHPNGSLDRGFGKNGSRRDFSGENTHPVVQLDGKIVTAGSRRERTGPDVIALARYLPGGARDHTFGKDGTVTTAIGGYDSYGYGIGLEPNGKIVVSGFGGGFPRRAFAVLRYLGGPYCVVPNVKGELLREAERRLRHDRCGVGHIRRIFSAEVRRGHILSQHPRKHVRAKVGTKVHLVIGRGARP